MQVNLRKYGVTACCFKAFLMLTLYSDSVHKLIIKNSMAVMGENKIMYNYEMVNDILK